MYILILDTATKRLSASLLDVLSEQTLAYYKETQDENSHARKINMVIQDLLIQAKIEIKQLSAIAVNQGPGSFTGLRVGSSTSKGLCFALDIPLIAICGLTAYVKYLYEVKATDVTDIFVLMDARRGNYFYSHLNHCRQLSPALFKHITDIETDIYLSRNPWVYYLEKENDIELSAKDLTKAVLEKWKNKDFVDIRSFEPEYIVNNYISKK